MISIILVDDEQSSLDILRHTLSSFRDVRILAECSDADSALRVLAENRPDLLFLDVDMPHKNGFDMLNDLGPLDFDIVFTTGYEQYALQAIKAGALDYLLKPISPADLREAVDKYKSRENAKQIRKQVDITIDYFSKVNNPDQKIVLPTLNGLEFIRINEILRVSSDSNYSHIYFTNRPRLTVSRTLKEMEELLLHFFFIRVHHSHLINLKYVKRYQKGEGGTLTMEDGSELSVSRNRKEEFLKGLRLFHS